MEHSERWISELEKSLEGKGKKRQTSVVLQVRLRPEELAMLDKMRSGYNRSEYFRYLMVSEYERRQGNGRPREARFCSDMRLGRPKETDAA